MFDLEGVSTSAAEEAKVAAALEALKKDPHAPRTVSVSLTLHVYNEYPKHVTTGVDKDDQPIVKVVNSKDEEKDALASVAVPTLGVVFP